jgi:pseudouridine-5'-monophosphatase
MDLKKRCMGRDSKQSARITIDEFDLPLSVDQFLNDREVFLRELFQSAPEINGAGQFITDLSETRIPFGLATSSHKHLCDLKLSSKHWGGLFDQIICGDHPQLKHGKPEPDIFLLCAEKLGVNPNQCIAFEDSPSGIRAAQAAGMQVIAVDSPFVEPEELSGAALIIAAFEELNPLLAGWNARG